MNGKSEKTLSVNGIPICGHTSPAYLAARAAEEVAANPKASVALMDWDGNRWYYYNNTTGNFDPR